MSCLTDTNEIAHTTPHCISSQFKLASNINDWSLDSEARFTSPECSAESSYSAVELTKKNTLVDGENQTDTTKVGDKRPELLPYAASQSTSSQIIDASNIHDCFIDTRERTTPPESSAISSYNPTELSRRKLVVVSTASDETQTDTFKAKDKRVQPFLYAASQYTPSHIVGDSNIPDCFLDTKENATESSNNADEVTRKKDLKVPTAEGNQTDTFNDKEKRAEPLSHAASQYTSYQVIDDSNIDHCCLNTRVRATPKCSAESSNDPAELIGGRILTVSTEDVVNQTDTLNAETERAEPLPHTMPERSYKGDDTRVSDEETTQIRGEQIKTSHGRIVSQNIHTNVTVATTNNQEKRKHDKKFYCLFCLKPQSKLKRHLLESKEHENEDEVMQLKAEQDQKKQDALVIKLRNLGNFLHNSKVVKEGKGQIAVKYRPKENEDTDNYGPCPHCYGYYKRRSLWRHKCPFKPESPKGIRKKQRIAYQSRQIQPQPTASSGSIVTKVLSRMRADAVSRVIKSDATITTLAQKLCTGLGEDEDQYTTTRQNLRRMGRLLIQLRLEDKSPNKSLKEFIDPLYFRLVCNATRNIAKFNAVTNRYNKPSLARKIGPQLEKVCDILVTEAIERQDAVLQRKVDEFKQLYSLNWSEQVSANASKTLAEARRNDTSSILPLADDVKCLSKYLEESANAHYQVLVNNPSTEQKSESWLELSEIILTQTILFNRRRAGEVSKMTLSDYENRRSADVDGPVAETLTSLEKKLCDIMKRTEIKGKRGRTVPVLFCKQMVQYLDCLLENRTDLVHQDNKFLFARLAPSTTHVRGTDAMRKFASACGAERPHTLRSTKLRKHIATLTQVMNLKDNELDVLAKFLGHDIRVHREYYRLADATVEVAKVAKLLITMEKGGHGLMPGQTLDSLELNGTEDDALEG